MKACEDTLPKCQIMKVENINHESFSYHLSMQKLDIASYRLWHNNEIKQAGGIGLNS